LAQATLAPAAEVRSSARAPPRTMALPKVMKAKANSAMKKCMKAKRVSKIARGRLARHLVLSGRREKTTGGITAGELMKNKRGKIVSKRASAAGKRSYGQVEDWIEAVTEARKVLQTKGFVAINGKTLHGKALYLKAKSLREERGKRSSSSSAAP